MLCFCTLFVVSTAIDVGLSTSLADAGTGFRVRGATGGDVSGISVSGAGDVNDLCIL